MYSSRFSVEALRLLIEFKESEKMFPSAELLRLYADLLQLPPNCEVLETVAGASFEYFYGGRRKVPTHAEYRRHIESWIGEKRVRAVAVELLAEEEKIGAVSVVVVGEFEAEERGPQTSAKSILERRLREEYVAQHGEESYISVRAAAEKAHRDAEKKTTNNVDEIKPPKPGILAFAVRRTDEKTGQEQQRASVREVGKLHRNMVTLRKSASVKHPVKMVYYKHHGQIRPPYYNVKESARRVKTRWTTKKSLPEEEYEYNSEEEWIEGDGEDIGDESGESEEEEEGEMEWIESDAGQELVRKGRLPSLDHPECRLYRFDRRGVPDVM